MIPRLVFPLLVPSIIWLGVSVMVAMLAQGYFSQWQTRMQDLSQLQARITQTQANQQEQRSWQSLSPTMIVGYQGLQVSGQWGKQSRLTWIQRLEALAQDKVKVEQMTFSARQPLSDQRVVGWGTIPLRIMVETLEAEVVARHEWHALSWLQTMDREVLPTALLQSCDWQLQEGNQPATPSFVGLIAMKCRWLIMEMEE